MLPKWQQRRQEIAELYREKLSTIGVCLRPSPEYSKTNNHKFSLLVENKWQFRDKMSAQGVETQLHYTYNFAKTPVFTDRPNIEMPGTEFYQQHAISIPSNPWLTDQETDQIIEAVKKKILNQWAEPLSSSKDYTLVCR
jgi:dTDP-4-amino-4,6-dideoxygalactose transaminase